MRLYVCGDKEWTDNAPIEQLVWRVLPDEILYLENCGVTQRPSNILNPLDGGDTRNLAGSDLDRAGIARHTCPKSAAARYGEPTPKCDPNCNLDYTRIFAHPDLRPDLVVIFHNEIRPDAPAWVPMLAALDARIPTILFSNDEWMFLERLSSGTTPVPTECTLDDICKLCMKIEANAQIWSERNKP